MSNKGIRWAFNFSKWNPSYADILLATSCIQNEEKERLAKFVFKDDFKSSLIGRLMMRKFVTETTGKKYNEIKFLRDDKGKPFLAEQFRYPKINYNVSHQGDFTVLAGIQGDLLLGVDVMKIEFAKTKSLSEYFRVMSRIFSDSEWATIKSAGGEMNQLAMFYRHWCLKESYLKAVGVGITIDLRDVCFKINTDLVKNSIVDDTEVYLKGERLRDWKFQEMLLDDNHCVAVALNGNDDKMRFEEISFEDLIKNAVPLLDVDEAYCKNYFKKMEKS